MENANTRTRAPAAGRKASSNTRAGDDEAPRERLANPIESGEYLATTTKSPVAPNPKMMDNLARMPEGVILHIASFCSPRKTEKEDKFPFQGLCSFRIVSKRWKGLVDEILYDQTLKNLPCEKVDQFSIRLGSNVLASSTWNGNFRNSSFRAKAFEQAKSMKYFEQVRKWLPRNTNGFVLSSDKDKGDKLLTLGTPEDILRWYCIRNQICQ